MANIPLNIVLEGLLRKNQFMLHPVVPFNWQQDKLLLMDFTESNKNIDSTIINDTTLFSHYINQQLTQNKALYGIGGYNEHRTIYARSQVFDDRKEPRRIHLGIDIWGKEKTPVFAPLGGRVHSFAFNNAFGDYGATIILQHQLDGFVFHSLFGHLALQDLAGLTEGKYFAAGERLAQFGSANENGHWPPHLHYQLIIDMQEKEGDYPGVCSTLTRDAYLANCPNADLVLQMLQFAVAAL